MLVKPCQTKNTEVNVRLRSHCDIYLYTVSLAFKRGVVLDVKRMMRSSENSSTGNMWEEDSVAIQGKMRWQLIIE